jgi:hypothetical protein
LIKNAEFGSDGCFNYGYFLQIVYPQHSSLEQVTDTMNNSQSNPSREPSQNNIQTNEAQKELCEEDIESFLENDKAADEEGNDESTLNIIKPEIGMPFKTREEAHNYFNMYAFAAGFSIAIVGAYRTTSRKRNNEITRVTIKCNKYGQNTEVEKETLISQRQSTVILKTDCKAEMVISEKDGIWRVKSLNLEHNHILDP